MTSRHSCVVAAPGSPGPWHQGLEPVEVAWSSGTTPRAASSVQGDLARRVAGAASWAWVITGHVCWWGHSRRDPQTPWMSQQFHFCVKCHNPLEIFVVLCFFIPFGDCKADVEVPL